MIKSRRLRWAGYVARMEIGMSAFKILTGKPTGWRPLGRPRRRWEDNIRMDLKEIGINEPSGSISYGVSYVPMLRRKKNSCCTRYFALRATLEMGDLICIILTEGPFFRTLRAPYTRVHILESSYVIMG